jgi:hypothetical protein
MHVLGVSRHLVNVFWLCHFIILKTALPIGNHICVIKMLLAVPIKICCRCPILAATAIYIRGNVGSALAVLGSLLRLLDSIS